MEYKIRVGGIKCSNCAKSIEEKLKSIDGVLNYDIDIKSGLVSVQTENGKVKEENLREVIENLGFDVL